jgi:hypothetical protein
MKHLLTFIVIILLSMSCSKDKDSNNNKNNMPLTDMQKSVTHGWVGFYQGLSVSKTITGEARLNFPVVVFSFSNQLKTVNLYTEQGKQIWSSDAKSGNYGVTDYFTDYATIKTHYYNFEFVLTDGTKLKLDTFPVTLN